MNRNLVLLATVLISFGNCRVQAADDFGLPITHEPDVFVTKFGWHIENDLLKEVINGKFPKETDLPRLAKDWNRYRDSPMYTAVIMRQIRKVSSKCDFSWALLVEACRKEDLGVSEPIEFFGRLKDGRMLVLHWPGMSSSLTGVLWPKGSWEKIKALAALDKLCQQPPAFESGIVMQSANGFGGMFDIALVHSYLNGKGTSHLIGCYEVETKKPIPQDARVDMMYTIFGAANLGDPIVKLEHDLGINEPQGQ